MLEQDVMNVDDVCSFLGLSRNTVYKLAKEGALPSFKVGRKLRFSRSDVENALAERSAARASNEQASNARATSRRTPGTQAAGTQAAGSDALSTLQQVVDDIRGPAGKPFVIAGEDPVLGNLAHRMKAYGYEPSTAYMNSYAALASLYIGNADAALANLYDFKTNSYNVPFVQRLCPGMPLLVIRLFGRVQGMFVRVGNPCKINTWGSLLHEDVRLAIREKGSGLRILMDQKLVGIEASIEEVESRAAECSSDALALARVAQGSSDVCFGFREESALARGVQFIPQQMQVVDLVVRRTEENSKAVHALQQISSSDAFRHELSRMFECKVERCGSVVYQC